MSQSTATDTPFLVVIPGMCLCVCRIMFTTFLRAPLDREREKRVFSLVKQIKFPSFPAHVCAPAFAGLATMCAPADGGRGGYESSRCGSLFTTPGFYAPPLTVERMCVLCVCACWSLCLYARNLHASSQTTSGTRPPREDVRTAMTGTATIKTGSA